MEDCCQTLLLKARPGIKTMVRRGRAKLGKDPRREALYTLLMLIPPGMVTTYGSLARLLRLNPRVVGRLLAENKNIIIIPCHRVVRSDGSLGGYSSGGVEVKRRLLEIEGVRLRNGKVDPGCVIDLASVLG